MKQTQLDFVKSELNMFGEISRNTCLRNYITRLASIIPNLKKQGWSFKAGYRETAYGNDFVYTVVTKPTDKYGKES